LPRQTVLEKALVASQRPGVHQRLRLTETKLRTIAVLGPEDIGSRRPPTILQVGSDSARRVGLFPGIEGQIRDHKGAPLETWPPSCELVSAVQGGQVNTQGSGSVLDVNCWFPTRDRATSDKTRYLFIEGASDDTISFAVGKPSPRRD